MKVSEELLEVVAEGGSKLSGGSMDVVARISINIQEFLAVLLSECVSSPDFALHYRSPSSY